MSLDVCLCQLVTAVIMISQWSVANNKMRMTQIILIPNKIFACVYCFVKVKKKMEAVAIRLAQLEQNCGVDTSVGEYLKEFHWGLTEVVYEWARQMVSFCALTVII